MQPLARLRLQLTAWYAGVFTLVLALLGAGLFLTIRHQMSRHVDKSLSAAAAALEQAARSEEHTSELQSRLHLVCRLLLEKKKVNVRVEFHPDGTIIASTGNRVTEH